jgi:UDP-N-acetylglucosamine--N-acetylmuramyl-(pentapeptide) pyrophosphoryl-undecaprenol N-acetylglucosamine transferase
MLRDHEVTSERLANEIDALLAEPDRLERMGEAARTVGHPDSAARVADLVEQQARR